jgi:hypothetical protein
MTKRRVASKPPTAPDLLRELLGHVETTTARAADICRAASKAAIGEPLDVKDGDTKTVLHVALATVAGELDKLGQAAVDATGGAA